MYKIKRASVYGTVFLALILQMSIVTHLKIFGAAPDMLTICVVFFGLFFGSGAGLECGIAAGLLKDVFSLDFFGINMLILAVIGLLAGWLSDKFSRESKLTEFVLVSSLTALTMLIHFSVVSVFFRFHSLGMVEYVAVSVIPVSIYTGIVSVPVFAALITIFNLKAQEEFL